MLKSCNGAQSQILRADQRPFLENTFSERGPEDFLYSQVKFLSEALAAMDE